MIKDVQEQLLIQTPRTAVTEEELSNLIDDCVKIRKDAFSTIPASMLDDQYDYRLALWFSWSPICCKLEEIEGQPESTDETRAIDIRILRDATQRYGDYCLRCYNDPAYDLMQETYKGRYSANFAAVTLLSDFLLVPYPPLNDEGGKELSAFNKETTNHEAEKSSPPRDVYAEYADLYEDEGD